MASKNLKIAFIGTGIMGAPIAGHIMDAGYELTVYNRTKEKAADLIERGAERLGVSILETHLQDASQPVPAWRGAMDVVLADVPCSGLGVIRKKPDIRYHEPSAELPALQRAILAQQAEYVRPGGVLLYSTCTILRRENEAVAEDFLRTHPDFVPENAPWPEGSGIAPGAMVTLLPGQHETDGFFICKFRRKP